MRKINFACHILILVSLSSCTIYTLAPPNINKNNTERQIGQHENPEVSSGACIASLEVPWKLNCRCQNSAYLDKPTAHCNDDFIGVAISGGGSRAAIFSAAVLFELEKYNILQQVDVISSVSGGSFTAALYALSCDINDEKCPPTVEGPERIRWDRDIIFSKLETDFLSRWVWSWFNPRHFIPGWISNYGRTDIMKSVIEAALYDNSLLQNEGFRFHDLNPNRPNLIINATNFTSSNKDKDLNFTFTQDHFDKIESNLGQYPIADAVMASAAFPGVFHFATLKDFSKPDDQFIHLFDGGTSDNLGLASLEKVLININNSIKKPSIIIILIDAFIPFEGIDASNPNPRTFIDRFVDTNFLSAYDTLMSELRSKRICSMKIAIGAKNSNQCESEKIITNNKKEPENNGVFVHITFDILKEIDRSLYDQVIKIGTSLNIEPEEVLALRNAAEIIVEHEINKQIPKNKYVLMH